MIKIKKRKILLLPGDGIGPEVVAEVEKIINWFNNKKSLDFEIDRDLIGGSALDKHGSPITDEAFNKSLESAKNECLRIVHERQAAYFLP